ncbi:MAG: SIS domain-containing protein [Clostridiales bacterium]|nr:MAG: SIS domain-containing protein [Clostridiales bacterium]
MAIGVSHSGSSKDVVEALKIARDNGAATICLTNEGKSPIFKAKRHCAFSPRRTKRATRFWDLIRVSHSLQLSTRCIFISCAKRTIWRLKRLKIPKERFLSKKILTCLFFWKKTA